MQLRKWPRNRYISACFLAIALAASAVPMRASAPQPQAGSPSQIVSNQTQNKPESKASTGTSEIAAALIGAIVGGLIGWMASLKAVEKASKLDRQREEAAEKRQSDSVRKLLAQELATNLLLLENDKERVTEPTPGINGMEHAGRMPFPVWNTEVWAASVLMLDRALDPEEIGRVQQFYATLNRISTARNVLAKVVEAEGSNDKMYTAYHLYDELSDSLIQAGNPLSAQKPSPVA